jgi:hypothetical protein
MAASGVRSSWLASATNWRSWVSLACRASSAEHAVQRRPDLPDLGARIGVGHALGEVDLAGVELQVAHARGGDGHPFQRAQLAADEHGAGHGGQQEGRGRDDHLDEHEPPDRLVDPGLRLAEDQYRPAGLRAGHHPVGAERTEVHAAGRRAGPQRRQVGVLRGRHGLRALVPRVRDCADDPAVHDRRHHCGAGRCSAGTRGLARETAPVLLGEAVVGEAEVVVEPADQELPQRQRRDHRDDHRCDRQQEQHRGDQAGAQRVRAH